MGHTTFRRFMEGSLFANDEKQNLLLHIKNGIKTTNLVAMNYGVHTVGCGFSLWAYQLWLTPVFTVVVQVCYKPIFRIAFIKRTLHSGLSNIVRTISNADIVCQ